MTPTQQAEERFNAINPIITVNEFTEDKFIIRHSRLKRFLAKILGYELSRHYAYTIRCFLSNESLINVNGVIRFCDANFVVVAIHYNGNYPRTSSIVLKTAELINTRIDKDSLYEKRVYVVH